MIDQQSAFFRLSDEMMSVIEPDGRIAAANRAFMNTLGLVEPIEGHSIFDLLSPSHASLLKQRLSQGIPSDAITFLLEFFTKNGEPRILKATLHASSDGARFALIGSSHNTFNEDMADDIRWRMALESTDAGFWSVDLTTGVAYFSERLETMLGYSPGELPLSLNTLRDLVHPEDYERRYDEVRPFLEGKRKSFRFECRVKNKSGRYTWIVAMGNRSVDAVGRPIAIGWHFDIQSLKESEERLRRSEERSKLLLDTIPDLLFVFDGDGKYLEAHTPTEEASVAPAAERIGRHVRDYFPAEFDVIWRGYLKRVLDEKKPITIEHQLDIRGRKTYFEARLFPLADNTVLSIMRDITEKHLAQQELRAGEERLRESEAQSQLLIKSIPDLLFVFDREGKYLQAHTPEKSKAIAPEEQLVGKYIRDFFPPEFDLSWRGYINKVLDEQKPIVEEYAVDVPAGYSYFEARIYPRSADTVLAIVRDITARRVAQAELRKVEERWSAFMQNCPAAIFSLRIAPDGDARYTYVDGRVEQIFEETAANLINSPLGSTTPPYIHPDDFEAAQETLRASAEKLEPFNWLGRFVLKSGRVKWINTLGTPTLQKDGSIVWWAIAMDVTNERELAQKVNEQQALMTSSSRLAALGEMASGIAHEINNPLTVAHAHAVRLHGLAESGRPLDSETIIKSTKKIEEVCMRISHIIAGLRSIARDGDHDRFVLSPLKPIIDDALAVSTEKFRHKQIQLIVDPIPESVSIECRSVQISQIIVNLLLNAQHAVESLGSGPRWIRVGTSETRDAVKISVIDSGAGVMPMIRKRIFDPFFTTKDVGRGTGLGLSVSASIAEAHGGSVTLDETSEHTTFVLTLPKRHRR